MSMSGLPCARLREMETRTVGLVVGLVMAGLDSADTAWQYVLTTQLFVQG